MTTVELLEAAWARADGVQQSSQDGETKREMALAKTAIEDAIMRFNRGLARAQGVFRVGDLEHEQPEPAG